MTKPHCAGIRATVAMLEKSGNRAAAEALKPAIESCIDAMPSEDEQLASLPPITIMGLNFAKAMFRHAASGFKRCSKRKIGERLAVCQACPNYQQERCTVCGCACNAASAIVNKLSLESESCPLCKW